ncbi:MAG: 3 beta-hydroxysteroid dehydrogenase/Delta 5--_4-isomerase [Flavobacterium sp. SCGC AAA160-P02]|nr:MAG: 3 beta-hydroxysteroid dehydrogenase/Delta 5-->4-isomerase [Flavobacterium sp. SCGC AAA160-P02]
MILVTGGTGLVGSHLLVRLTEQNNHIRAIYRTLESIEKTKKIFSYENTTSFDLFSKIEWVQADITDVPSMIPVFEGITKVYHCAALISFDPKDYIEMRKVNIHGTAIVVNLSIDAKVDKLCFVSSIASIGDDPKKEFANEENEWIQNDNNGYAITKYGAEMEVWRASQEGLDVVIANPGVILGGGFWDTGTGQLFSQVYKGFRYYAEGVTGFVGVHDVALCLVKLMEGSSKNDRFVLVSENKSYKEVLFSIADAFKINRPNKKIRKWHTSVFWRWERIVSWLTSRKPKMTKETSKTLNSKTYYSSEKISKELGVKFERIDIVIKKEVDNFLR